MNASPVTATFDNDGYRWQFFDAVPGAEVSDPVSTPDHTAQPPRPSVVVVRAGGGERIGTDA